MMLMISLGLINSLYHRNQEIKETKGSNSLFKIFFFENHTAGSIYFDTHIYAESIISTNKEYKLYGLVGPKEF